jgi:hypothetical protein
VSQTADEVIKAVEYLLVTDEIHDATRIPAALAVINEYTLALALARRPQSLAEHTAEALALIHDHVEVSDE